MQEFPPFLQNDEENVLTVSSDWITTIVNCTSRTLTEFMPSHLRIHRITHPTSECAVVFTCLYFAMC